MKSYPLFNITNKYSSEHFINWTKTLLTDLNNQVTSLYNYILYQYPDYEQVPTNNATYFNVGYLKYHQYIRTNEDMLIECGSHIYSIPANNLIISKARSEGAVERHDESIKANWNNYIVQPFTWASYYIPLIKYQDGNIKSIWTYDEDAEEKYGLNYKFIILGNYARYFLKEKNILPSPQLDTHVLSSSDIITITDNNDTVSWLQPDNPIMYTFYYNDDEIILDNSFNISTGMNNNSYITISLPNKYPTGTKVEVI